jgi:hypothetical protein
MPSNCICTGQMYVQQAQKFTNYLTTILVPLLNEGLWATYKTAQTIENKLIEASKVDGSIKLCDITTIFRHQLKQIPETKQRVIEKETNRIRDNSSCADIFDDLIRSVIKSNILVLSNKNDKDEIPFDYEGMKIVDFIHECYVECAKALFPNANLFCITSGNNMRHNQQKINLFIKHAIGQAILHTLPMKDIIKNYMTDTKDKIKSEYVDVKEMLSKTHGGRKILDSSHTQYDDLLTFGTEKKKSSITSKKYTSDQDGDKSVHETSSKNNKDLKVIKKVISNRSEDNHFSQE